MRITAPLLVLLCGCRTWTEPPPIDEPPVLDDDDATDLPAGSWTPQLLADIARNPDVGWVAANPNSGWSDLVARAGGQDPFRAASVIYTRLPVADWLAPADGSDNAAAGTGSAANQLSSAIDRGRYVGLRIVAEAADDLPSGWPTTTDPPGVVPDAAVSLVDDHGVLRPDYTDPDFRNFMFEVIVALGDRFGAASGPGLAFVDLGGIGDEGAFYFDDPSAWFEGDPPRYDDNAWTGTVDLWADTYRGAFGDDIPIFANWRVLQHAGSRLPEMLNSLEDEDAHLREDCWGGCDFPDPRRFPGGSGQEYPGGFGDWQPGDLLGDYRLLLSGGGGGLATWRFDDDAGTWDSGSFGSFESYAEEVLDQAAEQVQPSLVTLSETACRGEWAHAETPQGSACANQEAGPLWSVLAARHWGYRYVVTAVRTDTEEPQPGQDLAWEIDVANQGLGRAFVDRTIEVGMLDPIEGEILLSATPDLPRPTSEWGPGDVVTISGTFETDAITGSSAPEAFSLFLRVLEPRAFDGALVLPHPDRDDQGRYPLVRWPLE